MLKKKQRLNRKDFTRFFSSGQRFNSPAFQLIYTPDENFHAAAVVGKKVFKKAVRRNKLRRRVYGVLYRELKTKGATGVFIVVAKPTAGALAQKDVSDAVRLVLKQVPGLER